MRTSGSGLGWDLVFELGLSVGMVLVEPVGSTHGYSINMFLGLELCNYFGRWGGSLFGVSFGTPAVLMIGTREGYLVGLSLGISLVSSLESPNPGADLPGTLLGTPLGLWFGSEAVRCLCFCLGLMDFHEATCWGVDISCVPISGAFITSKMNSIRYYQLMEFLTL